MGPDDFDDAAFFRALQASGARVLLIGRRALILLGAPVMTADYDVWVHIEDIELLDHAFEDLGHAPNRTPGDARKVGRYVIENGERIDVIVARSKAAPNGDVLTFDDAWAMRQHLELGAGLRAALPCIEDLVTTKRWACRAKDLVDIQFLESLSGRPT
jgi:hypothetical protein